MATAAILDFWKRNFIGYWGGEGRDTSACQILLKLVNRLQRYYDFSRWRPPPSWDVEFAKFCWLTVFGGTRLITVPNFVQIGRSTVEILQFFKFSKLPPPLSWIVGIAQCYRLFGWRGWRHISVPNFVKIGQSVANKLRFFDFSRWWPLPSSIVEFAKLYWLPLFGVPRRITVQNFFKIGRSIAEILWFEIAKFYWFLGSSGSICICMPNFVEIGQSVAKILSLFNFSRWRPSAILDLFGAYLDNPQWVRVGLYHSAKVGYDRISSFYNINISIFDAFGWKMPIHAPKMGASGQFDPLNGVQYQRKTKKAHPCLSPCHLSH